MPTSSSRLKLRAPISSVFPPSSATPRATSPTLARPPSSLSLHSRPGTSSSTASTSAPKVLKKPKRQRLYGDGTELDAFDDLPTDRDKEGRYHVQPKGYGNRVGSTSRPQCAESKDPGKSTIRKKSFRSLSMSGSGVFLSYSVPSPILGLSLPRPRSASSHSQTHRKNRASPKVADFRPFPPTKESYLPTKSHAAKTDINPESGWFQCS
jgi:hypothetical protein